MKEQKVITQEEAIKRLKESRFTIQPYNYMNQALDIAISALEKQEKNSRTVLEGKYFCPKCENIAERYADCDEFVCSKCGIHLMDWTEVSIDEDYDDEIHSEYVFKYCPNCGAKIKEGD